MKKVTLAVVLMVFAAFLACSNSADPSLDEIDTEGESLAKTGNVQLINAVVVGGVPDGNNFKWEVVEENEKTIVSVISGLKELKIKVGEKEYVVKGKIDSVRMVQSKIDGAIGLGAIDNISGKFQVALPGLSKVMGVDLGECDAPDDCEEQYGPPHYPYQWTCEGGQCSF